MTLELEGKYGTATVMIDDIEDGCKSQIYGFLNHPAFTNPVRIMPDTHEGAGAVIGFTMRATSMIIPNVIGVDIGCGMLCAPFPIEDADFASIDKAIKRNIPLGFSVHEKAMDSISGYEPMYDTVNRDVERLVEVLNIRGVDVPEINNKWYLELCKAIKVDMGRVDQSIGTLGGGNHYIEIGKSAFTGRYYLTIHSGSRNFGLKIADYYQNLAEQRCKDAVSVVYSLRLEELKRNYAGEELGIHVQALKDVCGVGLSKDLSYLAGQDAVDYLAAMAFAQQYASLNREVMLETIESALGYSGDGGNIESIHNFIDPEDGIIRKGAIRSYIGEKMIIPFNMRDGLIICEGKSNPDWNYSAPHGAGRVMSRGVAKRTLDYKVFMKQMEGIYSTCVSSNTLDEAPDVYKPMDVIVDAIEPTATIVDRILPVYNLKG